MYRDEKVAVEEIPTLRMICEPYEALKAKVRRLVRTIGKLETPNFALDQKDGISRVGGGAFPLLELPSRLLCLLPVKLSAHQIEEWLRSYTPPIIVRVEKDHVLLDMRTVQEEELKTVAQAIKELAAP